MRKLRILLSMGMTLVLFLAPVSLSSQPVQAAPAASSYYVSPSGTGLDACTLNDPCSIAHAIVNAVDGDTIYLYQGTYTYNTVYNIADLSEDINMYGGLYGYVITPFGVRLYIDPVDHPSILDGETERRGIYIHGGVTPIIDGIKFINGNASLAQNGSCGGAQLTAQGCGGAIFIYQAAPTIQNCVFYENRAVRLNMPAGYKGYGGAIFVESPTGQVLIQHNVFDTNRATDVNEGDGSAIAVHGTTSTGPVTIWDNLFKGNVATEYGGAIAAEFFQPTLLLIQGNRFEHNTGMIAGAGIYLYYVDHATILNNWFSDQQGQLGSYDNGTVEASYGGLTFNNNTLIDNEPDYGLKITAARIYNPKVINNLFVRSGSLASIQLFGWGGPTGDDTFTANLKHNTLVGLGDIDSLAIEAKSTGCNVTNCVEGIIDNTILFKYHTGLSAPSGEKGKITADYTLFYQVTTRTDGYVINNHVVEEPFAGFKDYLHNDYHLVKNAPARDKGKDAGVTVDFEGDPRPLGGGFDLGYDEFAYHTLVPIISK
jgi:hypothetical protein